MTRILAIMGSGETSPTMVKVHRSLLQRLGRDSPAVMLDTPFGFQENADELCAKARSYFDESLNTAIGVASYRSQAELGTPEHDGTLNQIRRAAYVFAGPGSPSYALRQWRATIIPALLTEKLVAEGPDAVVTFASAAAVTLGTWCAPIYEIYKVGEELRWLPGIELVSAALGTPLAVLPHFNNAEGGTHDTRFCYLGERRLSAMEEMLDPGAFVLGIDEHTALILDLEAKSAEVIGHGSVTVRARGRMKTFDPGDPFPMLRLAETASELASATKGDRPSPVLPSPPAAAPTNDTSPRNAPCESPFLAELSTHERCFSKAMEDRDAPAAVRALLELDSLLGQWASETFSGDERERAHSSLRGMVLQLGEMAERGASDPRAMVAPFVEALLTARDEARRDRRFADADRLRDLLAATGVEVRDTSQGSEWHLPS